MSPQDTQVLQDFLNQLTKAREVEKDPEAEALIARAVAQQPDAAYLLVQRSLLLDQALSTAKAQIASLQNQLRAVELTTPGFLDPTSWGSSAGSRSGPAPMMSSAPTPYHAPYQPAVAIPAVAAPVQAPSRGFFGGGLGGTFGTVAATAVGVAGGAFLFQGIEHMMSNNNGGGFLGQQHGMASLAAPVENTTVNNYYGDNSSANDTADTDDSGAQEDTWLDNSSLA